MDIKARQNIALVTENQPLSGNPFDDNIMGSAKIYIQILIGTDVIAHDQAGSGKEKMAAVSGTRFSFRALTRAGARAMVDSA